MFLMTTDNCGGSTTVDGGEPNVGAFEFASKRSTLTARWTGEKAELWLTLNDEELNNDVVDSVNWAGMRSKGVKSAGSSVILGGVWAAMARVSLVEPWQGVIL